VIRKMLKSESIILKNVLNHFKAVRNDREEIIIKNRPF